MPGIGGPVGALRQLDLRGSLGNAVDAVLSFVNVGQIFYGFGWETMLLEAGFFAIFLGAARSSPQAISYGFSAGNISA